MHLTEFVILFGCVYVTTAIRITDVFMPVYMVRGSDITLKCDFDSQGAEIYVVKWYKDKQEFYHFLPRSRQQKTRYDLAGFKVKMEMSSVTEVTLSEIDYEAAGTYRCEVSAEAPSFWTAFKEQNISVVALPLNSPQISPDVSVYAPGDVIHVNCTSQTSLSSLAARHLRQCLSTAANSPQNATSDCAKFVTRTDITWFLNGEQVSRDNIRRHIYLERRELSQNPSITAGHVTDLRSRDQDELTSSFTLTSRATLHMTVRRQHFRSGEMHLKCGVAVASVYWDSSQLHILSPERHSAETLTLHNNGRKHLQSSILVWCAVYMLIHCLFSDCIHPLV